MKVKVELNKMKNKSKFDLKNSIFKKASRNILKKGLTNRENSQTVRHMKMKNKTFKPSYKKSNSKLKLMKSNDFGKKSISKGLS